MRAWAKNGYTQLIQPGYDPLYALCYRPQEQTGLNCDSEPKELTMAQITGIGGIFYRSSDPAASRAWYRDVLGLDGEYGPLLRWSEEKGDEPYSLISQFADDQYFKPGTRDFMINLRVDDLPGFLEQLRAKGVEILGESDEGYGRFAWILAPDGIKIELWQQLAAP